MSAVPRVIDPQSSAKFQCPDATHPLLDILNEPLSLDELLSLCSSTFLREGDIVGVVNPFSSLRRVSCVIASRSSMRSGYSMRLIRASESANSCKAISAEFNRSERTVA